MDNRLNNLSGGPDFVRGHDFPVAVLVSRLTFGFSLYGCFPCVCGVLFLVLQGLAD